MEIQQPKLLSDGELLHERVTAIREMSRLVVYLGVLNDESVARCPESQEATLFDL